LSGSGQDKIGWWHATMVPVSREGELDITCALPEALWHWN
jgi:hypothetical protein